MSESERGEMADGEWYTFLDSELESLRGIVRDALFEHKTLPPRQRGNSAPMPGSVAAPSSSAASASAKAPSSGRALW